MDDTFALGYALAKQLATAQSISTNYGDIELDDEMRAALDAALPPILKRRSNRLIAEAQPQH